ncbi:uncharacterized protein [Chironomus tepperi]|uniref:uncharacterized protein n=1 Tax=Chironomus tepperi TaxID=113505 RepID=UPI00391F51A0
MTGSDEIAKIDNLRVQIEWRNLLLLVLVCLTAIHTTRGDDEKQIKLEDIERDTLLHEERGNDVNGPKELAPQPTQHIQLSYSNNPQDVFVTPTPGRYAVKSHSIADLRQQVYHLPKVHEADQTYTVPAKQSLIKPIIGGSAPIHPSMIPQPQYIYIPSPPQAHHPYISQAPAYVMVPVVHQEQPPVHPSAPTPTIYTYSQPQPTNSPHTLHHHHQQQPSFHAVKSLEYTVPSAPVAPLHTNVDYKNIPTLVPKDALPSITTTSFRQYYSPGLEYHYTEIVPPTKLQPVQPSPSYAYHHAPTHNYQTSYVSQPAPIQYYQSAPTYKHQPQQALFEPYHSAPVTYAKPQISYKNYYPSAPSLPQQLFTPANYPSSSSASSSHYPYPSSQVYNTIAYSVPYTQYDHSKRSTKSTATASVNVKAPKSS